MVEAVPESHLQTESQIDQVFKRGVLIPFNAQCKYRITSVSPCGSV